MKVSLEVHKHVVAALAREAVGFAVAHMRLALRWKTGERAQLQRHGA